jgi:AsmA protein
MKKIAVVVGVVAGILVIVLAIAWFLFDVNHYRGPIQTQLEQQLGRKVTLGQMQLGLLPLRFQVADPVIAEDPGFGASANFLRAENLSVQVSLPSLIRGNIQVNSVELRRPTVELVKGKDGTWNFSTLGPSTTGGVTNAASSGGAGGSSRQFALDRLTIVDGQVAVTNLQQNRSRAVYDHIDLTLLNYTPGQPFSFDLAAHIQGERQQEIRVKGMGGPIVETNPAVTPFQANLTLNQVGLDGLKKFLEAGALTTSAGFLSGESRLEGNSGNITAVGKLKLDRARFNNVDLGFPITADFNLADDPDRGIVKIDTATLHFGQTPVSLAGSVNTMGASPVLDLKITSGDVSIAEIARLASAFGVALAPGTNATGRLAVDLQAKGAASSPTLTGSVKARDLQLSGQGVPPVEVKTLDVALSPTEIRSNEFNATSGKTTVAARFAVRQYSSNSPTIDAGVRAPSATLPEIQAIAKSYGVTGLDQITGAGTLSLDLHAAGPLQSLSSEAITRALNGTMVLDFSPLRIAGFDTTNELAGIGGFASALSKQNFTDILKFTGHVAVKNGVAQSDDLRAQLGVGNIAAAGTADLAAETLNMKLSTVFSKEFSDKVGSSRVGGYMKTALSNDAGELVVPAIVTGSFKQPKFAPDLQAFAQLQKQRLLPSLQNPAGALSGLLRGLPSKTEEGTQEQPGAEKANTVKGILGGLLGGKKKEPAK